MNVIARTPAILIVGALAALLVACAGSSGNLGSVPPPARTPATSSGSVGSDLMPGPGVSPGPGMTPGTSTSAASPASPASPAIVPAGSTIVRAYFVLGGEPGTEGLAPVLRVVPQTPAVATAAINALLAGPTAAESGLRTITSAVPAGSTLLGLSIKNSVATVNLSTEFDSGGGSTSMRYRLGQVVYTLTQFPTVTSVLFQVEGRTVTVFGSEGIVLDGPVGRADEADLLPDIFVDRPAYGAAIGNAARITGNANVFEAAFRIALLDANGAILLDQPVLASCGTGCRGTFDVTLRYTVANGQWGTMRAYTPSAKDGSPVSVREYPVWLTPANQP